MIGETKKYFIPDVNADELIIHESDVIGEELDPNDVTIKVKFLDGHWVQKFAVADTEEELRAAFEKFQDYRKKYHARRDAEKSIAEYEQKVANDESNR